MMETHKWEFGSNMACWVLLPIIVCTLILGSDEVVFAQTVRQSDATVVAKCSVSSTTVETLLPLRSPAMTMRLQWTYIQLRLKRVTISVQ